MKTKFELETEICDIITSMEIPFTCEQLLKYTAKKGISSSDTVLNVLDQLCDSGIVRYTMLDDNDTWTYKVVDKRKGE